MSHISSAYRRIKGVNITTIIVVIFFIVVLVALLIRAFFTVNTEQFLGTYQYMTSDSYDWLANGLLYFSDVPISYRNIGLPMIVRLLSEMDALWFLPYVNSLVLWIFLIILYRTFKWVSGNWFVSILSTFVLFINYELYEFTKYILSDFYAVTFIAWSVYFLSKREYKFGFLTLGISALFQNFAFFLLPVWLVLYAMELISYKIDFSEVKKNFRLLTGSLLLSIILFLLPNLPIMLYKLYKFGNPIHTEVTQFDLLSFHTNSISYYFVGMVDLFTPILLLLCCIGLISVFLTRRWKEYSYHVTGLFVSLSFWVLIYDWSDKRFLLYTLPFVLSFSVFGLVWVYQEYFTKHLRVEPFALSVLSIALMLTWVPSGDFFDSEVVHIIPTYAYELEHNGDEYLGGRSRFVSYPIREVLYSAPYWGDYIKYRVDIESMNMYGIYVEQFDEMYDKDKDVLCTEGYPVFDFYTLRSVFRIYFRANLTGEQVATVDCL